MLSPEYFTTTDAHRDAIDSTALCALEIAYKANREYSIAGHSARFGIIIEVLGSAMGPGSVGARSPFITEPSLANLAFPDSVD